MHSQINHSICSESIQRKRKHFHTSFYNPVAGILREGEKGNQGAQEPDAHRQVFPLPLAGFQTADFFCAEMSCVLAEIFFSEPNTVFPQI